LECLEIERKSLEYLPTGGGPKVIDPDDEDPLAYEEEYVPGRTWSVRLNVSDCEVERNGNIILVKDPSSGLQFRLREQKYNFSLVF
jgi:hypothetical protein